MILPFPLHPQVPIRGGFPSFSEVEIARRHTSLRQVMAANDVLLAAAYGAGRFNQEMLYLSNWPGGREGYFLLPATAEPTLLVQLFNHVPLAQRLSRVPDTRWAGSDSIATVAEAIREAGAEAARIGLIGPWTARDCNQLTALLPRAELVDITAQYREMRLIRSDEELAFFRVAAELTDRSIAALESELRPGLRENQLGAIVERPYLEHGGYAAIHYMSATPMSDPAAFVPHQYQSDRPLQEGDVLITEIGGSFWGYASQIHRTYTIGTEPTDAYRQLHEVAEEAFDAVLAVLRDGTTAEDVLDAAAVIHRRGYTIVDDLLHGADQYPPILRTWQTDHGHPKRFRFKENMVVTIQPHVTTPDHRIGLQFGETVRITQFGAESLHHYPRGPIVVRE